MTIQSEETIWQILTKNTQLKLGNLDNNLFKSKTNQKLFSSLRIAGAWAKIGILATTLLNKEEAGEFSKANRVQQLDKLELLAKPPRPFWDKIWQMWLACITKALNSWIQALKPRMKCSKFRNPKIQISRLENPTQIDLGLWTKAPIKSKEALWIQPLEESRS